MPGDLREYPQTSKQMPGDLRECCKCREKPFGVCRDAANAPKNCLAFATPLQAFSKSTLAATTLYRKHPIGIRKSIPSSNIRSGGVSRAKPGVYLRPTTIFDAVTLLLRSLPCIGVHRQEKRGTPWIGMPASSLIPTPSIQSGGAVADDLLTVLPLCASCRR